MSEFPAAIRLAAAGERAAAIERAAGAAERAAIADRLGLGRVDAFAVSGSLTRTAERDVYVVAGRAEMTAERICVVTLEPFLEETRAAFEEYVTPDPAKATADDDEGPIDPDATDIELLEADSVDVGELALQYVAMALDPNPRSPAAAQADAGAVSHDDGARRPFAGLDRLLKDARNKQ